jgi:hypothetical protein
MPRATEQRLSWTDTPAGIGRYAECPRQEDRRDEQPLALWWT